MQPALIRARALSGAACKVLICMLLARSALDLADLQRWAGLERHTLSAALQLLKDLDLVVKQTGPQGRALWFPKGETLLPTMEGIPPSLLSSSSSSNSRESTSQAEEEEEEGGIPSTEERRANHAALLIAGVREPAASELAALRWVTPDYINAHTERTRLDGMPLGTAIYRMRHQWEAPSVPPRRDPKPIESRYSTGAYSEIIEHDRERRH